MNDCSVASTKVGWCCQMWYLKGRDKTQGIIVRRAEQRRWLDVYEEEERKKSGGEAGIFKVWQARWWEVEGGRCVDSVGWRLVKVNGPAVGCA